MARSTSQTPGSSSTPPVIECTPVLTASFASAGRPSVAFEGPALAQPNDRTGKRFLLAPVAGDSAVQQCGAGTTPMDLARGPGRYDGIELLPQGRILVTAWYDSTVSEVVGDRLEPVICGVPTAADIGVDSVGRVAGVPMVGEDRVELWRLPIRATPRARRAVGGAG